MILLDTNIISELMRPKPVSEVIRWLDQQKSTHLFISAITIAEISYGLHALPQGNRRRQLEEAFEKAIGMGFKHRVLAFDLPAAQLYGVIMAKRKTHGRPLSVPDGQIAAIARAQDFILATRNERDFVNCGLEIINPFD